jgi:hypothetical protein
VVFPDPLYPISSTSTAVKTPGSTEEDPDDDLEPADEGDIQVEYFSD